VTRRSRAELLPEVRATEGDDPQERTEHPDATPVRSRRPRLPSTELTGYVVSWSRQLATLPADVRVEPEPGVRRSLVVLCWAGAGRS
jgi:hypothetical protein